MNISHLHVVDGLGLVRDPALLRRYLAAPTMVYSLNIVCNISRWFLFSLSIVSNFSR
jgi:hypothetical protein